MVEKRRFLRHLPVNRKQEYRREGAVKVLHQKSWREGAGQMPLLSAPSGQGSGSGLAREVSGVGWLITESRRWWRNAIFPGTCQSTKIRNTDGKEVVKKSEKKKVRTTVHVGTAYEAAGYIEPSETLAPEKGGDPP